ncbi:MAG: PTS sugar transporter subunit IIB [Culicoidibacterales bacterium]
MKNILLVCSAGMSTSLLVTKMEKSAAERGLEVKIWAVAEAEAKNNWSNADVLLLGPQVRFLESKMKELTEGKIPVAVIDMVAYGSMNGAKVLDTALGLIG